MNDGQLSAQFIANVAWAFSKASEAGKLEQATAEELFADLATAAEASVGDFTAADLANVAWAFANANQMDPTLFQSLANRADNFLDDFNDEELDNAEWAFARAGMHRIVKRPGVIETPEGDQIAIRQYMNLSCSVDHRLADGADAARFLAWMRTLLENPGLLTL